MKYDAVICDELGYVPFTKMGTELLFQFLQRSTTHGRTIELSRCGESSA